MDQLQSQEAYYSEEQFSVVEWNYSGVAVQCNALKYSSVYSTASYIELQYISVLAQCCAVKCKGQNFSALENSEVYVSACSEVAVQYSGV